MSLKLHTPPVLAVMDLPTAKLHLKETSAENDTLITALVTAATQDAEHLMGRAILPQKWQLSLDQFPSGIAGNVSPFYALAASRAIVLQRPTVTAVDSVKYVHATTGVLTTLDPAQYQACLASDYTASVVPAHGTSWPCARAQPESVQVVFTAGYATAADVPALIVAWIKLRLAALYENRSSWTAGPQQAMSENKFTDHLLNRYRVWVV